MSATPTAADFDALFADRRADESSAAQAIRLMKERGKALRDVAEVQKMRRMEIRLINELEIRAEDAFDLAVQEEERANELQRDSNEWKDYAEALLRIALDVCGDSEQRAKDALDCVALLSACLRDAEAECQDLNAQLTASETERDAARRDEALAIEELGKMAHERDQLLGVAASLQAERDAAFLKERDKADTIAGCRGREIESREDEIAELELQCGEERQKALDWRKDAFDYQKKSDRALGERDAALLDAAGWKRSFYEEQALRSKGVARIAELKKERDEAQIENAHLNETALSLTYERDESLCRASNATIECGRLEARLEQLKRDGALAEQALTTVSGELAAFKEELGQQAGASCVVSHFARVAYERSQSRLAARRLLAEWVNPEHKVAAVEDTGRHVDGDMAWLDVTVD